MTGAPRPCADPRDEMLRTNLAQRDYYDQTDGGAISEINSPATNLWRWLRARASAAVSDTMRAGFYARHREWIGDLGGKKVLELGCGTGTALSEYLADHAGEYHAIDLSPVQVAQLQTRLGPRPNARFHSGDILDNGFAETGFDVIYAHSVFHHFRHIEVLFDRLDALAAPQAKIITLDPLQSWLPARLFRGAFRPFQTDAAWEFPFDRATLRKIETHFIAERSIGLFERAKYALILGMISPRLGARFGDAWYGADLARDSTGSALRKTGAIQISYLLRPRTGAAA